MSKKRVRDVSHHAVEIDELRADRKLAVEYLKAAMESLDDPDDRAGGLIALRTVARPMRRLATVARKRESAGGALSLTLTFWESHSQDSSGCVEHRRNAIVGRSW